MYQIYWRSVITGATGHGQERFPKLQAEAIAARLNEANSGVLVHWCQPVEHGARRTYPDYEGLSSEQKIAACIEFELSRGGNFIAAARAILRDIELGYICLPAPFN